MVSTHLRILLIEDNPDDGLLLIREITRGGYEVEFERVETADAMRTALAQKTWDLIVCDYSLPQFNALKALEVLKASTLDLPFIIISGTIGEESAVTALKAGAHDFLIKSKYARLAHVIDRELREAETRREHRRTEKALIANEERFRRFFELGLIGMAITSPTNGMIEVNDRICEILGYEKSELMQISWDNITHPDDLAADIVQFNRILAGETNGYSLNKRFIRKDGQIIFMNISVNCTRQDDDSVDYVMALMEDVTERKRAEEAVLESEKRFRNLFENSPVAIWEEDFSTVKNHLDNLKNKGILDLEAFLTDHPEEVLNCIRLVKVVDVNQAAQRIHKAGSKAELLAGLEKTFTPEAFQAFKKELLVIANGGHSLELDEVVSTLDGEKRDASLFWAVAPDHEKTYSRVLVSFVDITERKRAEKILRLQDEELKNRNAELARLYRASEALLTGALGDLPSMAQTIVQIVLREFEHSNCSLLLINKETRELERVAVEGPYAEQVSGAKLSLDQPGLVAKAVLTGREINIPDVTMDSDYVPNWEAAHSELVIPLKLGDEVIGALDVQSSEPDAFHADDERLMMIFAERAALGLERTRLYEQTVRQLERLEALRTIDLAISNSLDVRVTLNIVLEQVTKQLEVDAASVLLMKSEHGRLEYVAGRGFHTHGIESSSLRLGEGIAGKSALERRIIHISNLNSLEEKAPRRKLFEDEKFVSYFGVPLITKGIIKGVLEIYHRSEIKPNMDWLNFLDGLGWQTAIAIDNALMFENMQRSNFDLALAYDATIEGWSHALDLRDKETEGHTQRVTEMTIKLAHAMNIHEDQVIHMRRGSLLHDIGKMGVPDKILHKAGPLTDEEWVIMRLHPQFAFDLLSPISYLQQALAIPYCHHEKWDGTGYPRGLYGLQIPLEARLFAIVDVWDALTSDRPYRKKWSDSQVIKYIHENSGIHFDPQVVEIFLKNIIEVRPQDFE